MPTSLQFYIELQHILRWAPVDFIFKIFKSRYLGILENWCLFPSPNALLLMFKYKICIYFIHKESIWFIIGSQSCSDHLQYCLLYISLNTISKLIILNHNRTTWFDIQSTSHRQMYKKFFFYFLYSFRYFKYALN